MKRNEEDWLPNEDWLPGYEYTKRPRYVKLFVSHPPMYEIIFMFFNSKYVCIISFFTA